MRQIPQKVLDARKAYRASLDECGNGDKALWLAMMEAHQAWQDDYDAIDAQDSRPSSRILNGVNLVRYICEVGGTRCAACHHYIAVGKPFTSIRLGPGDDPAKRKLAREGAAYEHVRVPVHWACATGEED